METETGGLPSIFNGCLIELVEPKILRFKAYEPILLLGRQRFAGVDMRIRVKGGGHTSQIYAIRQSIAKALVALLSWRPSWTISAAMQVLEMKAEGWMTSRWVIESRKLMYVTGLLVASRMKEQLQMGGLYEWALDLKRKWRKESLFGFSREREKK